MTDYSKNEDYAAKDALATGDPAKLILGSEIDAELAELVTAVASKFDTSDIASEAEAAAMVSNTTLITPARLGAALSGGGVGAGAAADLIALTDPGADRLFGWDDSASAGVWFTAGAGLNITDTTITVDEAAVDHDTLLNFVADEHVAHSGVTLTAGLGLSGGGTIAASRTFALDLSELSDATPDIDTDYFAFHDASDALPKKALLNEIAGLPLGDGNWYRSTSQAISATTVTTIVYDVEVYNVLERGSYSTSTGIYTAGDAGARIEVSVIMAATSLGASEEETVIGYKDGTTIVAQAKHRSQGGTVANAAIGFTVVVALGAGGTFGCAAYFSNAGALTAGSPSTAMYNVLSIVELG